MDEPNYTFKYRSVIGEPIDAIFGYVAEGLFQGVNQIKSSAKQSFGEVKPGDINYKDLNDDGVINEADQRYIGNWNSRVEFGFNLQMRYERFSLFIRGSGGIGGNSIFNSDYYWVNGEDKYSVVVLDSWTIDNPNASYPRLTTGSAANNFRISTYWLEKRNVFSIDRIQLTYDVNLKSLSRLSGFQVYVSASNLLTISNIKEKLNLNIGGPPQMRYYGLGVKLSFSK